jgi:hypothetical protein
MDTLRKTWQPKDEAWWKLRNTQLDTFSKFFSMVGVIAALTVASITYLNYLNQQKENERGQNVLDLHFNIAASRISDTKSAVLVTIDLLNKGKRSIHPYSHDDDKGGEHTYTGEGLTLSVTRHDDLKVNTPVPEEGERVVERYNILEKKYSYSGTRKWDDLYVIEPNVTNQETEAVVLQRGAVYEFRVRFYAIRDNDTWTKTETKYLYVD